MDSKGQKIPEKIISAAELDRRMNHDLQNANQPAAAVVVAEPIAQPMTPEEYEKAFKEIAALSDGKWIIIIPPPSFFPFV
jgi:hypothetical protein